MKIMFLDESGNHDLDPKKISKTYPVFALGGVIVDRAYLRATIEPEMRDFKFRHFGRDDIVLHTVDMHSGRNDYAFLANPVNRATFYSELNALLGRWDYKVVVCVFNKPEYIIQYTKPTDPYHFGLEILIERFCLELGPEEDAGYICAEKRNPGLDRDLLAAWERLNSDGTGTGYTASEEIRRKIVDLNLKEKIPNMVGLQLADLVITPVGRHVARRPVNPNQVQWSVVQHKLRRVGGTYMGRGLIIVP